MLHAMSIRFESLTRRIPGASEQVKLRGHQPVLEARSSNSMAAWVRRAQAGVKLQVPRPCVPRVGGFAVDESA